ncbi:MAG: DUF1080 domain-containing protein [Thermoguttaceae bacterium]|jgi:hypothetical protein
MKLSSILLLSVIILPCLIGAALFAGDNTDGVAQIDVREPRHLDKALINDIAEGFAPLFDGKTLNGWVQRGGKAKFTVEDGMIVGETVPNTPNSFLCTEKNYGDFILELDYKVDPELNSGVQFRSECFNKPTTVKNGDKEIKIPAGRVHGYQCEIDMDHKKARWWTAGIYDEGRREWLYPGALGGDKKTFTEQGVKISKQNQWNHLRIEAVGDSIKTRLNGVPVAEIKDSMTLKGFIALQVHNVGNRQEPLHVYFKNIRIKEIGAKENNTEK